MVVILTYVLELQRIVLFLQTGDFFGVCNNCANFIFTLYVRTRLELLNGGQGSHKLPENKKVAQYFAEIFSKI